MKCSAHNVATHLANDRAVLAAYGLSPSATEREIVAHLFRLYAEKVEKWKDGKVGKCERAVAPKLR